MLRFIAIALILPVNAVSNIQGRIPVDTADSTMQSRPFAKALVAADVQAKVVASRNKTHATINRELGLPNDEPTKAVFGFLDRLSKDR
jgi:hypothetical protein